MTWLRALPLLAFSLVMLAAIPASAEDGYELWLRYRPLAPAYADQVSRFGASLSIDAPSNPTVDAAVGELRRAFAVWTGHPIRAGVPGQSGIELCRSDQPCGAAFLLDHGGPPQIPGAYRIAQPSDGRVVILADDDLGLLYGTFALLRHLQRQMPLHTLSKGDAPRVAIRMLDHWDNIDGSVERGYAGRSIFVWWRLPGIVDPRLTDYARANASIGINAVAVNNVNAPATFLTPRFIAKARALADVLRPYGIRLFLSARFSALQGNRWTDDRRSPRSGGPAMVARQVRRDLRRDPRFWRLPGQGEFGRAAGATGLWPQPCRRRQHAGAAPSANAASVIWRAFVYEPDPAVERTMPGLSRVPAAGRQVRRQCHRPGQERPLDFQPREPVHPLFGAMPATQLGLEVQITKEYLGFSTHLAFLAPLFNEALDTQELGSDGRATLADVVTGGAHSLIAGVANIGADRNWTGSTFDQANWYAFGRLAWNPALSADTIAREWAAQTFAPDPATVDRIVR